MLSEPQDRHMGPKHLGGSYQAASLAQGTCVPSTLCASPSELRYPVGRKTNEHDSSVAIWPHLAVHSFDRSRGKWLRSGSVREPGFALQMPVCQSVSSWLMHVTVTPGPPAARWHIVEQLKVCPASPTVLRHSIVRKVLDPISCS